jgi:hypothetical protein
VKTGRGARPGWYWSPILFDWYSECLTEETLDGFGSFKIRQVILTVKYADDLLLAEEGTVLQGMTDRLNEIGMEMNVEKNYSDGNLKATIFNANDDR